MTGLSKPVVVIGAGLTGMSAAYHLRELGIGYRILERSDRPGGLAITVQDGGFCFDLTGHLLHLRDPDMRELVVDLIGDQLLELQRHSMVWSCGTYTHYPYQANTFGLPPEVAFECVMGFLRTLDRGNKPDEPVRDFEQFCLRHFGDGFSKHFMIPYNCRLWGVSPSEITADWCSRFVPLPKLEDVIAGALGYKRREMGYNARFLYPRHGIGTLSERLAARVGDVELSKPVSRIDTKKKLVYTDDGETIEYRVLISSAPLDRLVAMIDDVPSAVQQAAQALQCSSLWYLDVALATPALKPYHWVYVPESKYPFYRLGIYSNFSAELAPENHSAMYIELADRNAPNLTELTPRIANHLIEMGLLQHPQQLLFARARKIDHAYVIYNHAYNQSVETIMTFLRQRRIISTGRYGGWNYSAMEDALLFGKNAATLAGEIMQERLCND